MKIDDIRKNIVGDYGIANSNRYQISFLPPNDKFRDNVLYKGVDNPGPVFDQEIGIGNVANASLTSWLADEVNVPGFTVATDELKGFLPGINLKYAHTKTFSEANISFILDHKHTPYKVMQRWGEYVFGHTEEVKKPNDYIRTNYYDNYTADLIIQKIETNDNTVEPVNVVSSYVLKNAFPYTLSAMTFSNGPNQPVRFQAAFYYEYLREESVAQFVAASKQNEGTQKKIYGNLGMNDIPSSIGAGFA